MIISLIRAVALLMLNAVQIYNLLSATRGAFTQKRYA